MDAAVHEGPVERGGQAGGSGSGYSPTGEVTPGETERRAGGYPALG